MQIRYEQPNRLCQLNDFEQVRERAKKSGGNPAMGEEQFSFHQYIRVDFTHSRSRIPRKTIFQQTTDRYSLTRTFTNKEQKERSTNKERFFNCRIAGSKGNRLATTVGREARIEEVTCPARKGVMWSG
ncbi:hypothetical protein KBB27_02465 [Patescibacteria group bacterium]|nr:hypothetical protein [Patescibacteria group bacterium]